MATSECNVRSVMVVGTLAVPGHTDRCQQRIWQRSTLSALFVAPLTDFTGHSYSFLGFSRVAKIISCKFPLVFCVFFDFVPVITFLLLFY